MQHRIQINRHKEKELLVITNAVGNSGLEEDNVPLEVVLAEAEVAEDVHKDEAAQEDHAVVQTFRTF